jgi:alpha-amylase/alpha-mannosidase (GH57 family)
MKARHLFFIHLLLAGALILAGCGSALPEPVELTPVPGEPTPVTVEPTPVPAMPTPVASQEEEEIHLAIIWHQHQPVYYKDPETGIYSKPWVRVHATKDYVDMAAILLEYPDIKATFNLTPSLLRQIEDLENGAKDYYWVLAEVPAEDLNDEQKQFLLERFFDTNRRVIARFPRYQELLELRDGSPSPLEVYETRDYRDLQILFNLAWVDPDWLQQEPLASLVEQGSDFTEADKEILFAEHLRLIKEVIPIHRQLQDAGQVEITMTPYAHPILPLLISTDLSKIAMPDIDLGAVKFAYGQDAVAQINLGVELYEQHFGQPPVGMWPAEGAVSQEIVGMVSRAGIKWMASDEGVLANSLGFSSFTRDSREVVSEPDILYRPYYVQSQQTDPVAIIFRDVVISDRVGFIYSGMKGSLAALDFINRIHAIRDALIESGAEGPHLVSVILDGENAWEYYENDGKEFLHSLYQGLSDDPTIKTVTPSEYLEMEQDLPLIEKLWAGSWIGADFSTWIGEEEENRAWEYLQRTRDILQRYETGVRQTSPENLAEAMMMMYIAEGSDWFWWYGDDQDSGNDEAFDQQFRDTLKGVYTALGEDPPGYLDVPIIPQRPVSADAPSMDLISPEIDGIVQGDEWEAAGVYLASGGTMASADPFFESLAYGFDSRYLYIKLESQRGFDTAPGASSIEVYLSAPGGGAANNFSRGDSLLGFPANRMLVFELQDGSPVSAEIYTSVGDEAWSSEPAILENYAFGEDLLEAAIPLTLLGDADVGDRISMRVVYNRVIQTAGASSPFDAHLLPGTGPALFTVPDLGTTIIVLDVDDPLRDDHGPGSYTYPTDAVFSSGNYDITNFQVGYDDENIVFRFTMRGRVDDPWGSPNGLAIQTFDIYIDQNGGRQGGTNFLPGRNLALQDGYAWDYAITAEGWEPAVFIPGEGGPERIAGRGQFSILADSGQQKVTIRVPKSIIGDNPEEWRYAAMVLGQEGFPAGGVMRVRDVTPAAQQWRFGGAPTGSGNHTRVIDLVWPETDFQETWLSDFSPRSGSQADFSEADFAKVPMLEIQD